ncbi:TPA: hypothetical protein ACQYC4_000428 [Vibrio parahaemolyticus]|jgi:hypothetical protein
MNKVFYYREVDTTKFIRFFDNGTVVTASVSDFWLNPINDLWSNVSQWLTCDYEHSKGKYSIFGVHTSFFTQSESGTLVYRGVFNEDMTEIGVNSHSHINDIVDYASYVLLDDEQSSLQQRYTKAIEKIRLYNGDVTIEKLEEFQKIFEEAYDYFESTGTYSENEELMESAFSNYVEMQSNLEVE